MSATWLRELIVGELTPSEDGEPWMHARGVRLLDLQITGALDLEAVVVDWGVRLQRCRFDETPIVEAASMGELDLSHARSLPGLRAADLRLTRHLRLTGATVYGTIDTSGAEIGGQLDARGAIFDLGSGNAISARGADVAPGISLTEAQVGGTIDISGAPIGYQFRADGDAVAGPGDGSAVQAQGATIAAGMFLDRATIRGSVDLRHAEIGGPLSALNATIVRSGGGNAVSAQGVEVAGDLVLSGATVLGTVDIGAAHVGGQLNGSGATLIGSPERDALRASSATVTADLVLNRAVVVRAVAINGAHVGGQFDATDGALIGIGEGGAVWAQDATITHGIFLTRGTIVGAVDLNSAKTGYMSVDQTKLYAPGGVAIDARWSELASLVWSPRYIAGEIDVRDCQLGSWSIDPAAMHFDDSAWKISGLTYRRIEPAHGARSWELRHRIAWLNKAADEQLEAGPAPYQQMAELLRREGDASSARDVLIAGNERLNSRDRRGSLRRAAFGATIRYGYQPWRVLLFVIPLFAVLTVGVSVAASIDDADRVWMVTSDTGDQTTAGNDCAAGTACLQPAIYVLDTMLPVVDLGQQRQWTVDRSQQWAWILADALWVATAAGWFFAVLLAAAAGGLTRRV